MLKSLKTVLLSVASLAVLIAPVLVTSTASAVPDLQNNLCSGVDLNTLAAGKCATADNGNKALDNIITLVVNVFSVVVGFIAIIMMIYGGFKYITSSGDSGNVTAAKNTIMYALIGLVVVALAQVIVKFVLAKASNASANVVNP